MVMLGPRRMESSANAGNSDKRCPNRRDRGARGIRTGNPGKHNRSSGGHFPSSRARRHPALSRPLPASFDVSKTRQGRDISEGRADGKMESAIRFARILS